MNKISYKRTNYLNKHKLTLKATLKDNKLQKQLNINQFNIIELNEEEMNRNYESNINIFSEREILRLKKKATLIENYYSNKSEDTSINENCFNCLMNNFKPNELLYFSKRKDLLSYLKYCFYFLKKILFLDNQIYNENRYDLDKCNDPNYLNGWRFFIPKTVCRACFLQIINTEHLFGNLKTIFTDVDPNTTSRNLHRNRSHFNSRSRASHPLSRKIAIKTKDINENEENGKNKIYKGEKENNKSIKNIKENTKNGQNLYNDKNGLNSNKKNIFGEVGNSSNQEEKGQKTKGNNKSNSKLSKQNDEQSVTEIKIKSSDFIENENEEKKLKENKLIIKDENKINGNNKININHINSNNKNLLNEAINNSNTRNNENENQLKEINNKLNKNNMNIINEILNIKHMYNGLVIKLHFKLNSFKELLLYTIINIGDFKEKLYNSMHFNPDIISYGINRYEQYFTSLYNEGFKAKKDYEEMFTMIKNESIPSIKKNILKLKEEKLDDDDKKNLDEMENFLKEYSEKIDEMIKRYEDSMNNFFTNFFCFFNLMKELKTAFSGQIY